MHSARDQVWFCRDKDGRANNVRYKEDYLGRRRVELLGGSQPDAAVFHLPLANHVHDLDAAQQDAGTAKRRRFTGLFRVALKFGQPKPTLV